MATLGFAAVETLNEYAKMDPDKRRRAVLRVFAGGDGDGSFTRFEQFLILDGFAQLRAKLLVSPGQTDASQ
jgi:hypothetical protein